MGSDNGNFDESPTGHHRFFPDGSVYTLQPDGTWVEITQPHNLPSSDPMSPIIQSITDLIANKATRTVGLAILAFFVGGGGGMVGFRTFGESVTHEEYATKAQVEELTEALKTANTQIAELQADVTAHVNMPTHPQATKSIDRLSDQVTTALRVIDEMHPVTRQR